MDCSVKEGNSVDSENNNFIRQKRAPGTAATTSITTIITATATTNTTTFNFNITIDYRYQYQL